MSNIYQNEVYKSCGYTIILPYDGGKSIDINYINSIARRYAPRKILVRLDNTIGLSTSNLSFFERNVDFHIMGGYDDHRVNHSGNYYFSNGETGSYYTSAVIYQIGELHQILRRIEAIEKGIKPSWSPLQKFIYIYEEIEKEIIYDPKFEMKSSREVRSLRGLINRQSVCAGFSIILKEILDRNGIPCEYVEGHTNRGTGHAWNIVTIDGKKIPVDLTWDTRQFLTTGKGLSILWLTKSPLEFAASHIPNSFERTKNYPLTLSRMPDSLVKNVRSRIRVESNYKTTVYHGKRSDGSMFIVSSLSTFIINGITYYNYFYQPIYPGGRRGPISLLYGKYNITKLLDDIVWNRNYNQQERFVVDNVLFSEANIRNSSYVGDVYSNSRLVRYPSEIVKTQTERQTFDSIKKKVFTRRDNSQFYVRDSGQIRYFPSLNKMVGIRTYYIVERLYEGGEDTIKTNIVYTEMDLINDGRDSLIANFLTRTYIERKIRDGGGYIGYLDNNGDIVTHPFVSQNFDTSARVDANNFGIR